MRQTSSNTRKNEVVPFAEKIDAGIKEREISHQHEDKYCVFSLMCGVSRKNKGHKSTWGANKMWKGKQERKGG